MYMTQLIKFFFTGIVFLSCKDFSDKKVSVAQNEPLIQIENDKDSKPKKTVTTEFQVPDINGVWSCYDFAPDVKGGDKGDLSFAEEMSKYAQLKIENNQLTFNNCKKELYYYKYPVKLKKYEDESVFITFFKPKKDSVYFVGSINSGENNTLCDIFDSYTFYLADDNTIVQYYRGYFFYYKKSPAAGKNNDFEISGIPGNNKNEWTVKGRTKQSSTLGADYENFKKYFPYGSKNLSKKIPPQKEFTDKINGILYRKTTTGLEIIKDDPLGKILISFTKSDTESNFTYEFRYPEY